MICVGIAIQLNMTRIPTMHIADGQPDQINHWHKQVNILLNHHIYDN